jgi:uncharacterized membrane protein YphA (DoxX/SURF4 family)
VCVSGQVQALGEAILFVVKFSLSCLFLRAGIVKFRQWKGFQEAVAAYQIVPSRLVPVVAVVVPSAEAIAGCMLALGVFPVGAAGAMVVFLGVLSAAMIINIRKGRIFDCGCAAGSSGFISWGHVLANTAWALCALAIVVVTPSGASVWPGPRGVWAVGIPVGGVVPLLLSMVLVFIIARLMKNAVTVRRLLRS